MIQFILPAASALAGKIFGQKGAEAEAEEKLDLIKKLANLTPEQANAVDALKKQSIEEVRVRHELGVGPYAPLPANASARAQEIRQARIAAASKSVTITPDEQARVASASNMDAALNELAAKKTQEILAGKI